MNELYENYLRELFCEYFSEYSSGKETAEYVVKYFLDENRMGSPEEFLDAVKLLFEIAVVNKCSDIVQLVVNQGASVDALIDGLQPLQVAIGNEDINMVRTLLENNVRIDPRGGKYRDQQESFYDFIDSMLGYAISLGHEDIALMLLNHPRMEIPDTHWEGWSLLCQAVLHGLPRVLTALLENENADPNEECYCWSNGRCEPLHLAIEKNDLEIAKILVEHEKTDINLNSGEFGSVLDEVLLRGTAEMLRLLIKNGLELNEYIIESINCKDEVKNILMEHGYVISSEIYKYSELPPLALAANSGDLASVNSALEKGARLDEITSSKKMH